MLETSAAVSRGCPLIGAVSGIAVGLVLAVADTPRRLLAPYFMAFYGMPRIALGPLFIIWFTWQIPALVFIGLWFLMQFMSGISALNDSRAAALGGVAWWAHVGGFLTGMLLARVIKPVQRRAIYN